MTSIYFLYSKTAEERHCDEGRNKNSGNVFINECRRILNMRKNITQSGKIVTAVLAATLAAGLLAGCNGERSKSTEKTKGTTEVSTEVTTEKTEAQTTETVSTEAETETQTTEAASVEKIPVQQRLKLLQRKHSRKMCHLCRVLIRWIWYLAVEPVGGVQRSRYLRMDHLREHFPIRKWEKEMRMIIQMERCISVISADSLQISKK